MESIIKSIKITAIAFIMCVAAFMLHVIQICLIPEEIALMNPLISGFLHQGVEHLSLNMIVMFIGMLHPINRGFNWRSIFIITTIISLIYLPIAILGITSFAIGLSGTCYFFLTRATINWGWIGKVIIFILFCLWSILAIFRRRYRTWSPFNWNDSRINIFTNKKLIKKPGNSGLFWNMIY